MHHLGVGIFTIQDYKRKKKESKKIFNKYNNKRSRVLTQQLNRLHDNWLLSWDVYVVQCTQLNVYNYFIILYLLYYHT